MTAFFIYLFLFPSLLLAAPSFDFRDSEWHLLLQNYVKEGRVDYAGLIERDRGLALRFLENLSRISREAYESWPREERIAFWINAYNAAALQLVLDHYPLKRRLGLKSAFYPSSSIQQIPKVWKRKAAVLLGRERSLDEIEHEILRKEFKEPRIHFALVCASVGCPPLWGEPYEGMRLEAQLEDQLSRFLLDPEKFRYEEKEGKLYLSPIFKWFREDFEKEGSVISFIKSHLPRGEASWIPEDAAIEWLDYDWSLNEQK